MQSLATELQPNEDALAVQNPTTNVMKDGKLFPHELFWRDHRSWLEERGYVLRRRYQPDWVASWLNPPRTWLGREDAMTVTFGPIMDAIRRSDGAQVLLKHVKASDFPDEANIGQMFSSEPLASDPRNHCVPIYEILVSPEDKNTIILVMPFLLGVEEIPFDTIGEVVDFFRQILEGLQLMHENRVSHRDPKYNNIMMDGLPLYKKLPHPLFLSMSRDFKSSSKIGWSRTRKPVKYYFIDFGLSKKYPLDGKVYVEPPGWTGDKSVPEFRSSDNAPCDPFAVDIYCIGNLIRSHFLEGERNAPAKIGLEFMTELVSDMVKDDPAERPKIDEVVKKFATVVSELSDPKLRSRITYKGKEEKLLERKRKDVIHWCTQTVRRWLRVPAIPTP